MSFIRAGVIGYPLHHTKSPLIHNHWIAQYGLSGDYGAIPIVPETLAQEVAALAADGYAGFNVTIPHKQAIFTLCETVDDTARAIGAVNTVVIRGGVLHGMNTDAFGFMENLRVSAGLPDFGKGPVVVLGAGGAARAVVYGLLRAGAKDIVLTNRTQSRAEELAAMNPCLRVVPWEVRADVLNGACALINTTALGMSGKEPLELDLSALPPAAVVADIVYVPLMTPLLEAAEARGNTVVTGIGMLLHQARPAFEQWFGVLPEVDSALEEKVLA